MLPAWRRILPGLLSVLEDPIRFVAVQVSVLPAESTRGNDGWWSFLSSPSVTFLVMTVDVTPIGLKAKGEVVDNGLGRFIVDMYRQGPWSLLSAIVRSLWGLAITGGFCCTGDVSFSVSLKKRNRRININGSPSLASSLVCRRSLEVLKLTLPPAGEFGVVVQRRGFSIVSRCCHSCWLMEGASATWNP